MLDYLKGIWFMDPDDIEVKDFMKIARKKLEGIRHALQGSKTLGTGKLVAKTNPILADQNMHVSWKLTDLRESALERLNKRIMRITLLGRGSTRWVITIEQLVKSPTWQMTKVRSKREVIPVRQKEGRNSSFSYADERMPPQQLGVTAEVHTIQRTFFRVDSVKDDSDSSAVFTEQDSDRRQDKQLMQCPPTHQTRWRTLQHCWKIPGQSVQTSGDV